MNKWNWAHPHDPAQNKSKFNAFHLIAGASPQINWIIYITCKRCLLVRLGIHQKPDQNSASQLQTLCTYHNVELNFLQWANNVSSGKSLETYKSCLVMIWIAAAAAAALTSDEYARAKAIFQNMHIRIRIGIGIGLTHASMSQWMIISFSQCIRSVCSVQCWVGSSIKFNECFGFFHSSGRIPKECQCA